MNFKVTFTQEIESYAGTTRLLVSPSIICQYLGNSCNHNNSSQMVFQYFFHQRTQMLRFH